MKDAQTGNRKCLGDVGANGVSRRTFVKGAAAIAAAAAAVPLEPLVDSDSVAEAANGTGNAALRMNDSFRYRSNMAQDERINVGPQSNNGDIARFTDFSGSYSKALLHDS